MRVDRRYVPAPLQLEPRRHPDGAAPAAAAEVEPPSIFPPLAPPDPPPAPTGLDDPALYRKTFDALHGALDALYAGVLPPLDELVAQQALDDLYAATGNDPTQAP